jgi:acyl-[acyl-carrier-protein]-phospholipid O-acyltransferase/long-chain-fatty-acid--[acyl-carrier-protein] ligase
LATGTGWALLGSLCGLAVSGGLFIVPAFTAVQAWSPPEARARVIASVNVLNAAYMVAGGAIAAGAQALGAGVPVLFAALGVLSIGAVLYVLRAWGKSQVSGFRGQVSGLPISDP